MKEPLSFGVRLLLLAGLTAALLLPAAGLAPLERAEIYFVDAARAMVERGDYVVPHHRGEPFFDKPPLTYWLIAGAFRALSFTLAAARLVPAIAATATVLATVWLGGLLFDRATGLMGGLLLVTTLAFASFGRIAMSDMLLALFSTLSVGLGVVLTRAPAADARAPLLALAVAGGLGFLTKGPVAVLLPGLGLALLGYRSAQGLRAVPARLWAAALLLFCLVGGAWFLLVYRRLGLAPLEYFFLHENLERFAGGTYDAGQPLDYFLGVYVAEGLPWSLFLPAAVLRVFLDRKRGGPASASSSFLLGWVGLMLVPLSASRGKLDYYLLPAYPALSLVIASWLRSSRARWEKRYERVVLAAAGLALGVAPLLLDRLPGAWMPAWPAPAVARAVAALLAVILLGAALRSAEPRATAPLAAAFSIIFVLVSAVFVPALRQAQPNADIVADVVRERNTRPDVEFVYCQDPTRVARDLLFEARVAAVERCDLWGPAASPRPYLLLVAEGQQETLRLSTRFVARYGYLPGDVTTLSRLASGVEASTLVLVANYPTNDPEAIRRVRRDLKRRVQERERRGENEVP